MHFPYDGLGSIMQLIETSADNITSLHIELSTYEKIKYPVLKRNRVNLIITSFFFIILFVWIIRNDGDPGATDKETLALVVILPLILFIILTFYNYFKLRDYQKNDLCQIQVKPGTNKLKLSNNENWVSVQAVVVIPEKISVQLDDQNMEDIKEFHEFYPIYYDFKLAHLDGVAYQDLVDIITKKVSGHLSVDVREFDS